MFQTTKQILYYLKGNYFMNLTIFRCLEYELAYGSMPCSPPWGCKKNIPRHAVGQKPRLVNMAAGIPQNKYSKWM